MTNVLRFRLLGAFGLLIIASSLSAQRKERPTDAEGLPNLAAGNNRFTLKLLRAQADDHPNQNVVFSPLPLTLLFAAIDFRAYSELTHAEIASTFGWEAYPELAVPSRMLISRFNTFGWTDAKTGVSHPASHNLVNVFRYRPLDGGKLPFEPYFLMGAQKWFGFDAKPTREVGRSPLTAEKFDATIESSFSLQLVWSGNTFSMSKPHPEMFHNSGGVGATVPFISSELSQYPHLVTPDYEAVELPCNGGSMVLVLPAEGKTVEQVLELENLSIDDLRAALKKETGILTMPEFHLKELNSFVEPLRTVGLREIFHDLEGISTVKRTRITEISQKVDIDVDVNGIRANAETFTGAVYGGIGMAPKPFRMRVDRPFAFFVCDSYTNAVTFAGVVQMLPGK